MHQLTCKESKDVKNKHEMKIDINRCKVSCSMHICVAVLFGRLACCCCCCCCANDAIRGVTERMQKTLGHCSHSPIERLDFIVSRAADDHNDDEVFCHVNFILITKTVDRCRHHRHRLFRLRCRQDAISICSASTVRPQTGHLHTPT